MPSEQGKIIEPIDNGRRRWVYFEDSFNTIDTVLAAFIWINEPDSAIDQCENPPMLNFRGELLSKKKWMPNDCVQVNDEKRLALYTTVLTEADVANLTPFTGTPEEFV